MMKPNNAIQFFTFFRKQLNETIRSQKLYTKALLLLCGVLISTISFAQIDVRVSFSRGFIGTKGTSTNSALAIKTFPTLGVTRAYFIQPSTTGLFSAQGNDIPGTVRLVLTSGSTVDVGGAINWRGPSGNNIEYFGFIPDPTITPIVLNLPGGGTYTINSNSNFGLLKNGSTYTLTDNTDITGNAAMTGILDALNNYLITQRVNGGTIGANQTICSGSTPAALTSLTLASGGEGTLTYQWQQSTDNTNFSNVSSGGTNSGSYSSGALTATTYFRRAATDGANTGYSDTLTITVTAAASAGTLSGTQTVCVGSTTTFSSTVTGGTWTSSNTSVATVNASSGVITGVAAGSATITYTVAGTSPCPNATATRTVTVSALPTAGSISGGTSVCVGSTSTLSSTVSGGSWTSSNTSIATVNASSGVVTGVAAGTVTITYTVNGTGACSSSTATATTQITVSTAGSAGTLSGTQSVCVGLTTTFSSSVSGGSWTSSSTSIATVNASTGVITGVAAGTATITYTVSGTGGCANATSTRTVTVEALPAAAVISVVQPTCTTATGTITVTSPTGAGYAYSLNGGTYQSSVTFAALPAGSYTIRVRNAAGCVSSTTTNSTINSQPATPATPGSITGSASINSGTTQTYSVQAVSGATSYTWTLPNGWVGSSTTSSITVQTNSTSGTISVVANANGCTSASSSLAVTVNTVTDSDGDGIPDSIEGNGDADGDGIPNYLDLDSDGDGIPDSLEGTTDTDGDGIPNYLDLDSDGDGIPDSIEDAGCNGTAPCTPTDTDGDGIPNYLDLDSDGDGIPDSIEDAGCNGTAPCTPTDTDGDGIPNYLDLDSDGDGIPDSIEDAGCNGTAPCTPTDTDGDGIPNYLDLDSDNDGIPDSIEDAGCNGTAPCTPTDTDGDGIPNYLDLDSDNDGIPDSIEDAGCNGTAPCTPTDTDGDGIPNYLDLDSDNDGIPDSIEAGPNPSSPRDSDNDGTPDYLDLDSDNDGIPDSIEDAGCNGTAPCTPTDTDGDGIPNYLDLDSDNDGIPDSIEDAGCNGTAPCTPTDTDGDGIPNYLDLDSDNDGIPDSIEDAGCNGTAPCTPTDTDGDGIPNYLDLDSDNDGIPDSIEDAGCNGTAPCTPTDTDGDGIPNYLDLDSDNDGIPDSIEDAGCNGTAPCTPTDTDGDGIPNYLDLDSDNDGIPDSIEDAGCNGTAPCTPTDTDGDGIPNYLDLDSDNDGIPDSIEDAGCNGTAPCTPTDTDGDGIPNYLDLDSDNDGILDSEEDAGCTGMAPCTPTDTDGDGIPNYLDTDSDNDGCSDANEAYNSLTAQGTDGNLYYGNGNPPTVNSNGQVVGATYPTPSSNYTTAGAAPVVTGDPTNILTSVGATVSFTATATVSTGTITYQWQVSTNSGSTWSNVALLTPYNGVTSSILSINGVTAAMQGNRYRVIASQTGFICGADTSAAATLSVNFPPDAVNDVASIAEDVALTGNLLSNDTDPNSDPLTVVSFVVNGYTYYPGTTAVIPGVGTILINANGTYTFTPVPNYNGTVPPIAYTISDGNGGTDSANLLITVTPVNDAPVANNDTQTTLEDTPVSGNVLTNDTDIDGNPLTVTQFVINGQTYTAGTTATIPGVGTMVINTNGTYTFTPAANYNGTVPPVQYSISDGQGGTASATLQIAITPVNDAPVANNDAQTTLEDTPAIGNVLTNDTDVDGNTLTVTQYLINGVGYPAGTTATIPGVGTLVINTNGTYTFTPAPNYNGTVPPVQYTISDGQGGTANAILQITVTPVNDAPVANNDSQTTLEDTPAIGNVLTNDTDVDGNPLTVTQFVINGQTYTAGTTATIPGVGTMVINANGTYTFTPAPNYNGTVPPVQYTISDGQGGTASATLQIAITPVNDAPVANNDAQTTLEDTPAIGNVLTNDTDVDGNPLTVTQFVINGVSYPAGTTATIPGVGTLVINMNGTYTFTPLPNYNGPVPPVQYTVSDGQGGTAIANLQITIQSVADPEDIQINSTPVCNSGAVTLQASTTTVPNPIFKWYTDATLVNLVNTGATYVTPTITISTTYYVTVSGTGVLANQSGNAKIAVATILPAPGRPSITALGPLTFCKDDSVVLKAGTAVAYQWYKNGVAIPGATTDTYVAKTEGDYTVVITNSNGCPSAPSSPAAVKVPCVKGIHMPTIFTPNGDGKNDVVKPSVPGMKKFECFKVYNRWGNLVFECYNVLKAWDGSFKGVIQPAETYIWIVQGQDGQGKPMRETGMITLIR